MLMYHKDFLMICPFIVVSSTLISLICCKFKHDKQKHIDLVQLITFICINSDDNKCVSITHSQCKQKDATHKRQHRIPIGSFIDILVHSEDIIPEWFRFEIESGQIFQLWTNYNQWCGRCKGTGNRNWDEINNKTCTDAHTKKYIN